MTSNKNILVAPLNWGLGHATRCIPIIKQLLFLGYNPIIGSDGEALLLLKKEFPKLKFIELPSYNIRYPKNGLFFKFKLISSIPSIYKAIVRERKLVNSLVEKEKLIGIISDNRLGVINQNIPSVIISHQLNVFSGTTTFISSLLHQYFINKFDECWIPDIASSNSLAFELSHSNNIRNKRFIGFLSRFKKQSLPIRYDLLILLSGVEPLRSKLEKKLISALKKYKGKVLFVSGIVEKYQKIKEENNITYCNYLLVGELEKAINESDLVIARAGYSTIMDLAVLGKKAFFIPTEGQYEQEYLAKYLKEKMIAPYCSTKNFDLEKLNEVCSYEGFNQSLSVNLPKDLFYLFECKREF